MQTQLLEELKSQLLSERTKLEAELGNLAHRAPNGTDVTDFPSHGDKEDENAAEVAEFSDNLSLESELESALKDVHSALKAVDNGSYGKCKYCQNEIDVQRLKARPTSTSCIACKKTLTQEM